MMSTRTTPTPTKSHPPTPVSVPVPVAVLKELHKNLSNATSTLTGGYDALQGHTMQVALLGAEIGNAHDVKAFRQQMKEQDTRHHQGVEEIQSIIDHILENEGTEMKEQVNREIVSQIDALVQEQVARCLKDHIPQDLQQELAKNKQEFEELQLALHNSESRRLNGSLRANRPEDALHTIYMSNGVISPRFPKDLKSLFSLDGDILKDLLADYGLTAGISDIRDANLNKFIQFCGVRYQLVVRSDGHKSNTSKAV